MAWMKPGAMEEYWANRLQQDRKDVMSNLFFPMVAIFLSSSADAERAFSSAGFIIVDSLRTRMRPELVRLLSFGRSVFLKPANIQIKVE
jgi:hypothetical protein